MTKTGLAQAGAWNYLREEITVALECQRPVRTNIRLDLKALGICSDSMFANIITYILARIINHCFTQDAIDEHMEQRRLDWYKLDGELKWWMESLPGSYAPFSVAAKIGNEFPSEWHLRPWHGKFLYSTGYRHIRRLALPSIAQIVNSN